MPRLYKPTKEELEALRAEATKNGKVTEEEWVAKHCELVTKILLQDPLRYRSYGPYWWVLKSALLERGASFGFFDFVDAQWMEAVDYGSTFLNLLAAWMYAENALDMGLIYSHEHTVAFEPEEEGMEQDVRPYFLIDEDMETLALEKHKGRP